MSNGNGNNKYTRWIWTIYNNRPAYTLFRWIVRKIVFEVLVEMGWVTEKQAQEKETLSHEEITNST